MSTNFTTPDGTIDFDKVFDTGRSVINASQTVYDSICDVINGNYQDPMSRRSYGGNYGNPQYAPNVPINTYNYGYEENVPNYYQMGNFGSMSSTNNQWQSGGYPGFWNPRYGKVGGV
jgi:hypothetical protein